MAYFKGNFPRLYYTIKGVTYTMLDILRGVSFSQEMKTSGDYFVNYKVKDHERLDTIAKGKYGDPYGFWTIAKENDIIDPMTEMPKPYSVLDRYIASLYPGRAWFVCPTPQISKNIPDVPYYCPGVYTESKSINIRGTTIAWGNFDDDGKTSFELYNTSSANLPGVVKINTTSNAYPKNPDNTLISGGTDWYFGSFLPNVGTVIAYRQGISSQTGFGLIMSTGSFSDDQYRFVVVTSVNKKYNLFSVQPIDNRGPVANGKDIFSAINQTNRFYFKTLWQATCYNHDVMLGRILVTASNGSPIAIPDKTTMNILGGISAVVTSDMRPGTANSIRKFWIYKEVSQAKDALAYFVDTNTNTPTGTASVTNVLSGNTSDSVSHISKYVTGFYPIPANIKVSTIKDFEIGINESNRNIKLLTNGVNTAAIGAFSIEIKK